MVTVCKWIQVKILPQFNKSYTPSEEEAGEFVDRGVVNIQNYAVNVIREWGEVFCGFGAYSVQEVFFRAGLFYCIL